MTTQIGTSVVFVATPAMIQGMGIISDLTDLTTDTQCHLGPRNFEPVDRLPAEIRFDCLGEGHWRLKVMAREMLSGCEIEVKEEGEEVFLKLERITFWWTSRIQLDRYRGLQEWTLSGELLAAVNKARKGADRTGEGEICVELEDMEALTALYEAELQQRDEALQPV